jgi:hypothetical protein
MKVNRREFLTYSGLVGGATAFYGVPLIAQSVARITDFLPSVHAWRFSNFGGFGNCGGMCWTALDCFYLKQTAPVSLPVPTPALRDRIERRQKDTMDDFLWAKVVEWTALPDIGHPQLPHSVTYRTRHEGSPLRRHRGRATARPQGTSAAARVAGGHPGGRRRPMAAPVRRQPGPPGFAADRAPGPARRTGRGLH